VIFLINRFTLKDQWFYSHRLTKSNTSLSIDVWFRYEIKTPLPVIWLGNIDTKKSGLVRTQRTDTTDPGWSGWRWREIVHKLILQRWQCDLNKRKNIIHSSWSNRSSLSYFTLASAIEIFNVYLPTNLCWIFKFYCDHRLTSFCQLDLQEAGKLTFKVSSHFECQRKILLEVKF
jgi:hypothetical protein